ncbi:MAG: flotillin-like FloA family protein, partial [Candidatus Eremiobacteraeota bacterium]|nr:flotillin-like FloA family protein [Candidatus Eremiobacteraeota bacterium]
MIGPGLVIVGAFVLIVLFFVFLYYFPFGLWIRAQAAGVHLGIFTLVRMRLMGVPPSVIVDALIMARKAGLNVTDTQLQSQYLSGGHVDNVT